MPASEMPALAEEIREFLVDQVSETGGHLASNLGAGSSHFRRGTSKLHSQTADGAEGALSHSAAERGTERFSEAL